MRKLTTGLIETTTTRLYHEVRDGNGPLVLMVPGATGDGGHFDEVATRLADDHTVVTYDRRGNSRSPRTAGPTTIEQQADDVAALVRAVGRGRAILFGTSGGAIIALATLLRHPDVVASAILHEPPLAAVVPAAHEELTQMKAALEEVARTGGPVAALEAFLRSQTGAAFDTISPGTRARMLGNADTLFGSELDAFVTWQPDEAALSAVKVPVRILIGSETTPLFRATTQWLAQRLRTTVDMLPGAHAPYFDRPQVMADALRPLLRKLSCKEPTMMNNVKMQLDAKGAGEPVVLVGGGLAGWQSWIPHQEKLASSRQAIRAQPLAVQLGFENAKLPADYSIRFESEALAAGLDARGLTGPIDLVGWSFGGFISLDFALQHPDRIRTLTLIEPPAIWVLGVTGMLDAQAQRESDEMRALYATMTNDVTEPQLGSFVRMAGLVPPGKVPADLPAWSSWLLHRRSLRTGDVTWAHHDDAARLRAFDRPVLLVKGTGSSHFLHRIIDGLAATLPNAELIELPGGHAPQMVAMSDFLSRLAAFQAAR